MPFIHARVSTAVTEVQKEEVKTRLGKAITCIPGKSEQWLMVGMEASCDLYFQGNCDRPSAFIEVKLYGKAPSASYDKLTAVICDIFEEILEIPKNRTYIAYSEIENWGFNGSNF